MRLRAGYIHLHLTATQVHVAEHEVIHLQPPCAVELIARTLQVES